MIVGEFVRRLPEWKRLALDNRLMVELRPMAIRLIEKFVLLQAALRGLDYILLPPGTQVATLSVIERALPLTVWGWMFLGFALMAYAGMWWKQSPCAALGHMIIGITYGVFAIGAIVEVTEREGGFFGWRTGTAWVTASVVHVIYAREAERTWRSVRGT